MAWDDENTQADPYEVPDADPYAEPAAESNTNHINDGEPPEYFPDPGVGIAEPADRLFARIVDLGFALSYRPTERERDVFADARERVHMMSWINVAGILSGAAQAYHLRSRGFFLRTVVGMATGSVVIYGGGLLLARSVWRNLYDQLDALPKREAPLLHATRIKVPVLMPGDRNPSIFGVVVEAGDEHGAVKVVLGNADDDHSALPPPSGR